MGVPFVLILTALLGLKVRTVDSFFTTAAEEKSLADILQTRLTKHSPPAGMLNETVFIYLSLYQIVDVDERNGVLTVKLWMYLYYKFKEPLWDPAEYSNTTRMQFLPNTFWKPDVVPLDAIEVKYESYDYQAAWAEGLLAAWSSMVTMKLSCSFNVKFFPYDKHYCPVSFGQWVFNKNHYVINHDTDFNLTNAVDLSYYKPHDQWILQTPLLFNNCNRTFGAFQFSDKVLHIHIQRDPKFYSIIFVVPVVMLYILSPLVFLLPVESGEKISMSITLLLAQIVSMGVIADVLPASSKNFPIISYFLGLSVLQMGIQTVLTVIVINVHGLSGCHKVPHLLRNLLSHKLMYLFCMTPCPQIRTNPLAPRNDGTGGFFGKWFAGKSSGIADVSKESSKVYPSLSNKSYQGGNSEQPSLGGDESKVKVADESVNFRQVAQQVAKVESKENMESIWKHVAVLLDRILFLLNVLIIAASLTAFNLTTMNDDDH